MQGKALGAIALAAMGMAMVRGGEEPGTAADPLRVVIHVNFAETGRQGTGLRNVGNILKEAKGSGMVEVVCHGDGIGLVVSGQSLHAVAVADLVKQGVRFMACENTMRERSIARERLLADVGTVPSGAV